MKCSTGLLALGILFAAVGVDAFSSVHPSELVTATSVNKKEHMVVMNAASSPAASNDAPPLRRTPPRKIALFVEPTPFTHISGYSNRFNEMLRYLKKAGDEVEILTTDELSDKKDLPKEAFGFKIHHTLGFIFFLYKHITLTFDLPDLKGAKMLERLKPDLIHVTSPGFLTFAAMFYARVMRIPLVASYHTHLPAYGKTYMNYIPKIEEFSWWLIRIVHTRTDLTLVTSPQLQQQLIDNGVPRVDVWRKGIDTVRFDPKFRSGTMRERMTEGNPDDFLMVYIGRVGDEKRLKDIKPILERMPNARLCIVGQGPQLDELKEYYKGTNTHFTGLLGGDELSEAFASGDVFVMPSDSETLGFVVLESMASGVPVVGVNAGGIPNLVDDGNTSFLVPTSDTDAFVDRLTLLRDDKELRSEMGKNARKEAERWGWEAATSVLRNVQYERAMINFHSRAFGGFGRPGSKGLFRLLYWRFRRILFRLRVPGFKHGDGMSSA